MPEIRPALMIGNTTIRPAASYKFLGVLFDRELRWREQSERVVAKATKWALCTRQLARPATGISPRQMRQLYQAVAVPPSQASLTPLRSGLHLLTGSAMEQRRRVRSG